MEAHLNTSRRRKELGVEGYKWSKVGDIVARASSIRFSWSSKDGSYVRVTVIWAQTNNGEELVVPVVQWQGRQWSRTLPPPCPPTSPRCSSAPSASTMCCRPSCSARAGTWCAPAAGPSCRAALRAAARSATSATSPWRRWPVTSCFPASTPTLAAPSRWCTRRRRTTRTPASLDHTPAPAREPPANGREA